MKVLVALSGGVDSAVSAFLLKSKGYDVVAVHFKTEPDVFFSKFELKRKVCCSPDDTADARKISSKLGIDLKIVDLHERFEEDVVKEFVRGYVGGTTPNPCVWCNRRVKFPVLRTIARETGADFWATGHYARVKDGKILTGRDSKKDQSYFLSMIKGEDLEGLLLPLGDLTKIRVREIAAENDLVVAGKPDSQDVCFVPDGDVKTFFGTRGVTVGEGKVFDLKGNEVGKHSGYQLYAVGQRKGVGVALGKKVYVVDVDPASNAVFVGTEADLLKTEIGVSDLNLFRDLPEIFECTCKIRSTSGFVRCVLKNGNEKTVEFEEPVMPAPGQIVAFYDGELLIGGGVMKK